MSKPDTRKAPDHKALGKGLHALLPGRSGAAAAPAPQVVSVADGNVVQTPIAQVKPNPNQPRRDFDEQAMLELAQSVERDGIIQPIIVRRTAPQEYQIIAGERRWRAATLAKLTNVPIIVREADDQKVLELAIVENIQREDLNPIELAIAFERMASELGLSHEEIGQKTGKDRTTVTNAIRLLQLPPAVQKLISSNELKPGHARALLKIPSEKAQQEIAERCVSEGWSVRQIEEFTKPAKEPSDEIIAKKPETKTIDPNVKAAIGDLERILGTRVRIMEKKKGKGTIEVEYYSEEDLDRIYSLIVGPTHSDPAML
ncbi:MAG TPA: ParB/RepB/Spo0J family partition protein [Bryobacteraceae bacterium]|jgi:ParB family chromosome partitioning protein